MTTAATPPFSPATPPSTYGATSLYADLKAGLATIWSDVEAVGSTAASGSGAVFDSATGAVGKVFDFGAGQVNKVTDTAKGLVSTAEWTTIIISLAILALVIFLVMNPGVLASLSMLV